MKVQVFIHPNVIEREQLVKTLNAEVDYVPYSKDTNLSSHYSADYNRIGFVWDNKSFRVPFGSTKDSMYKRFKKELVDYLSMYDDINVDFMSCEIATDKSFINEATTLQEQLKLQISYTSTLTPNVYFNNTIVSYKHTLGPNRYFSGVVSKDHELYTCGDSGYGALGYSVTYDDESDAEDEPALKKVIKWIDPLKISSQTVITEEQEPSRVHAISFGRRHGAVIRDGGKLYMAGRNGGDQSYLGLNTTVNNVYSYTRVTTGIPLDRKVVHVSCGNNYTMVVLDDGSLYACGSNSDGKLGLGNTTINSVPMFTKIILPMNLKVLSAGCSEYSSIILCDDGKTNVVYTCGNNSFGQLGLGDNLDRALFTLVPLILPHKTKPVAVCAGTYNFYVLLDNGVLYGAGDNSQGQLANGTNNAQMIFSLVNAGLPDKRRVVSMSAGADAVVVILDNYDMYFAGKDYYGKFGLGTSNLSTQLYIFQKAQFLPQGTYVKSVTMSNYVTSILLSNGGMYTAGTNYAGSLAQANQDFNAVQSIFAPVQFSLKRTQHVIQPHRLFN